MMGVTEWASEYTLEEHREFQKLLNKGQG